MGIVLGLFSALLFSSAAILARFGMRSRSRDDGVFMSIFVNLLILGVLAIGADLPDWNTTGVVALAVGGVLGTFGGRATNLRAIRIIGPSRANAFLTGGPLVSAVGGWLLLGESISLLSGLGGLLVLMGLYRVVRSPTSAAAMTSERRGGEARADSPDISLGFAFAMTAPILFGMAFVVRKWGLEYYPTALGGAFIGASAAMTAQIIGDAAAGSLTRRLRENLRGASWWFVGAGVFTSAALVTQFFAFDFLPAWVVSLLQSTQVLWTLLLAALFLRREEHIDRRLVMSIVLVSIGVAAITSQY